MSSSPHTSQPHVPGRVIRCLVEYDGEPFVGWQRQPQGLSIQQAIEEALVPLLRGAQVPIFAAGRTDAGVHALGQVFHFQTEQPFDDALWAKGLNARLPRTIRVVRSEVAEPEFHSRRSAQGKRYEYRVLQRKVASAVDRKALHFPSPLDWDRIEAALPLFVGTHDFAAFRAANANTKTTVRTVHRFELHREGDGLYRLVIEGNGFLKQMVRTLVGTLLELGLGRRDEASIERCFAEGNRRLAGRTVAPEGLFLVRVYYPMPVFTGESAP